MNNNNNNSGMMYSKVLKNIFGFTQVVHKHEFHRYNFSKDIPGTLQKNHMNLFTAVNSAIDISLESDSTYYMY